MAYTSANLISAIERKSFSPANQATFLSAEILAIADEVIKSDIVPAIMAVREEFFVTYTDYTVTASQASYDIPARAIGMVAREIHLVDSSGNITNLPRMAPEDLATTNVSAPTAFYLRGNSIVLYPTPSTTASTLRVYYHVRPGDLVAATAGATISAIDTGTNVITVTTIPSTWVTGDTFDLIKKNGAHEYRSTGLTSTLISGTAITLPSLPSDLAVGDYVALEGFSPLVQLPPDFQPVLATLVAAEILINQSQPGGKELMDRGIKLLETAQKLITPRVVGEPQVIVPEWF